MREQQSKLSRTTESERGGAHGRRESPAVRNEPADSRLAHVLSRRVQGKGSLTTNASDPLTRAVSTYSPSRSVSTLSDGCSGSTTQQDGTPASA